MPILQTTSSDLIATVVIDRQERRNAIDHATLKELRETVTAVATSDAKVMILTGAGKNFCAGADISTVEDGAFVSDLRGVLEDLRALLIPVIGAIRGPALGAGTQLAMACDLRIATTNATFGIPAAKLGLTVDQYTVHHLANEVGHSFARAMLTGAETFGGQQLAQVGFVHRLVDDDADVLGEARAWGEQLVKLAPLTIAAHKTMLRSAEEMTEPTPAAVEARKRAWESDDLKEGVSAFGDRRAPNFVGR